MQTSTLASPPRAPGRAGLGVFEKIDVCRGLFAYLVVVAHARDMAWSMHPTPGAPGLWESIHAHLVGNGIYWVMGFFVISGYCIQLSVERLESSGSFRLDDYLAARLTRILPLYYIGFLFAAGVEWLVGADRPPYWTTGVDRGGVLRQLFGVQGIAGVSGAFGSYGPSWSITNELVYYLAFGLLVVACAERRIRPGVAGLIACFVIGAALQAVYSLGWRSAVVLQTGMLFGLGSTWFLGVLVARRRGALVGRPALTTAARFWPILLLAAMAAYAHGKIRPGIVFVYCGGVFALMLIRFLDEEASADRSAGAKSEGLRRVCRGMGLSSYPTYLFHGPMLILIGAGINRWSLTDDRGLIWAVSAAVSIACGWALGYLLEQPIMAWRAGVLARRRERSRAGVGRIGRRSFGAARRAGTPELQEGAA